MKKLPQLSTQLLSVGSIDDGQARKLTQALTTIPGVFEAAVRVDDGVAHLKVNRKTLDNSQLELTMRKILCPEA